MQDVLKNFRLQGGVVSCEPYGCGHINRTYLVVMDSGKRYILQGLSTVAFKDIPGLMENVGAVTRHLAKKVSEERGCLHLVPTVDGADYYHDGAQGYWRVYDFVEDSLCLQAPETPEDFYQSAVAFGTFQRQLADFPAETLHETIENFHNTPDRYAKFKAVLAEDRLGRAAGVRYEIEEFLRREADGEELLHQRDAEPLLEGADHDEIRQVNTVISLFLRAGHDPGADVVIDGGRRDRFLLLQLRGEVVKIFPQQGDDLLHIQADIGDLLPRGEPEAIEIALPAAQLARDQLLIVAQQNTPAFFRIIPCGAAARKIADDSPVLTQCIK